MKILFSFTKSVWSMVSTCLFLLVMVQILCFASASFSTAQVQDVTAQDATYWKEVFKNFKQPEIETIQKNLNLLGYNTLRIDGKIGPKTSAALNQFCDDFKIEPTKNSAANLVTFLSHYADVNADVAEKHKGWKKILFSDGVDSWLEKQPEPQKSENNKIRRSGTAQQIIELLDAYERDNETKDEKIA